MKQSSLPNDNKDEGLWVKLTLTPNSSYFGGMLGYFARLIKGKLFPAKDDSVEVIKDGDTTIIRAKDD